MGLRVAGNQGRWGGEARCGVFGIDDWLKSVPLYTCVFFHSRQEQPPYGTPYHQKIAAGARTQTVGGLKRAPTWKTTAVGGVVGCKVPRASVVGGAQSHRNAPKEAPSAQQQAKTGGWLMHGQARRQTEQGRGCLRPSQDRGMIRITEAGLVRGPLGRGPIKPARPGLPRR